MTLVARAAGHDGAQAVEWGTFSLISACYIGWAVALFWLAAVSLTGATVALAVLVTLHSSLTHEVLHGHPFRSRFWNEVTMWLPLGILVPYGRFRDLHLAHHRDSQLTDPYDDPESNYLDPEVWQRQPAWMRRILLVNNTLAGRILIGPVVGMAMFYRSEWRLIRGGDRAAMVSWGAHLPGVAAVLAVVLASGVPLWAYGIAVYVSTGILRIRTFLEHQAHERCRARTVIIEDRGLLAFLFLNNNFHVVHHMHPGVPWHKLPALYRSGRARFLTINDGYVYRSYGEVFRRYLFRRKDPVAHPLWRRD